MVGICLIYAISGILLNHLGGEKDPAYKTVEEVLKVEKRMNTEEIAKLWNTKSGLPKLKKIFEGEAGKYTIMLDGGIGSYDSSTGDLKYEHHSRRQFIYWINKLHYNKINGWTFMADFFAISLIFFAVSGLFIVSKKNGIAGRGKWFVIAGICIPIIYLIIG